MSDPDLSPLEDSLRAALRRGAAAAPLHPNAPAVVAGAAARRVRRTRTAASLSLAAVVVAGAVVGLYGVRSRSSTPVQAGVKDPAATGVVPGAHLTAATRFGSLVLPLAGTVSGSGSAATASSAGAPASAFGSELHAPSPVNDASGNGYRVDTPPAPASALRRLSTRTTAAGVTVSTFLVSTSSVSAGPASSSARTCAPTGQVALELSDTEAVATFDEPYYSGYRSALVDVEIGEFGSTEGYPATWVEAEVGGAAARVAVRFADGVTDVARPAGGVVVLADRADATTAVGGGQARLVVLGTGGAVLDDDTLAVTSAAPPVAVPDTAVAPTAPAAAAPSPAPLPTPTVTRLPSPGRTQPADAAASRRAVVAALQTALSCDVPPVDQAAVVRDGGFYEAVGGVLGTGRAWPVVPHVDGVVFTGATTAVVEYHDAGGSSIGGAGTGSAGSAAGTSTGNATAGSATAGSATAGSVASGPAPTSAGSGTNSVGVASPPSGSSPTGTVAPTPAPLPTPAPEPDRPPAPVEQLADVYLARGHWLVSLASAAPQLQRVSAVGALAVAPGGPLFTEQSAAGDAVAVYRAAAVVPAGPCAPSGSGCGPGAPGCAPAAGLVEEITTPGAVATEARPAYTGFSGSVVDLGIESVGTAEGSPATVVTSEVGPGVARVVVTTSDGVWTVTPEHGIADVVLAGGPGTIGTATFRAEDAHGHVLAADTLTGATGVNGGGATTLPSSLPAPGVQPRDEAAARLAVERAFATVYSCSSPPIERAQDLEGGGALLGNPLEQLDAGPYAALVASAYVTVSRVVFVAPAEALVSYVLRFHRSSMTFPLIGEAQLVDGSWRVSYATVCAAAALGGASCPQQ